MPNNYFELSIPRKHAEVTCLADTQPSEIKWLLPNRIALGKLSLIGGDPGLGKSLVTLYMAATVSNGGQWPDGTRAPQGSVLMLSAEDDMGDTIRPRLDACGGDAAKVHVLTVINDPDDNGEDTKRGFSLKCDLSELDRILTQKPDICLVVIDPITAYLGGVDSHKNADVRALLGPLSELASRHGVAVVAVTHLNKGDGKALYRQSGSIAFTAAARASYVVFKDKDDPDRRLFIPVKNNLGDDRTGFAYRVVEAENKAPCVEWEPDLVTIDDVDAEVNATQEASGSALAEATEFLFDTLKHESMPAKDVLRRARDAGHSEATIRRAKEKLQIISVKQPVSGCWHWGLKDSLPSIGEHVEHHDHVAAKPF